MECSSLRGEAIEDTVATVDVGEARSEALGSFSGLQGSENSPGGWEKGWEKGVGEKSGRREWEKAPQRRSRRGEVRLPKERWLFLFGPFLLLSVYAVCCSLRFLFWRHLGQRC